MFTHMYKLRFYDSLAWTTATYHFYVMSIQANYFAEVIGNKQSLPRCMLHPIQARVPCLHTTYAMLSPQLTQHGTHLTAHPRCMQLCKLIYPMLGTVTFSVALLFITGIH